MSNNNIETACNNNLLDKMTQLQNNYYENTSKNFFLKRAQKLDCAAAISNSCDIDQLLQHTIYLISNTNKIYIDYNIFKMYANPQNYNLLINRLNLLIHNCMHDYSNYEMHINMSSFTVSACERHKAIFSLLLANDNLRNDTVISGLIKLCIYNPPSAMDTVFRILMPFIHPDVYRKITLYSKKDSESCIRDLFA